MNTYKKFYAINLTAIAAPNLKFTYAFAGWPGSRQDSHVFSQSKFFQYAEEKYMPLGYYLVGDSGYTNFHWLMTPYSEAAKRHPGTGKASRTYNFNHASTRVVVEQAFALLKGRFRILKCVHCKLKHVAMVTMACVVLHNMCIQWSDPWHKPTIDRPTYNEEAKLHRAGTTCQNESVPVQDPERGHIPPKWMKFRKERGTPRPGQDSSTFEYRNIDTDKLKEKYKCMAQTFRNKLRNFVQNEPLWPPLLKSHKCKQTDVRSMTSG